MAGLAIPYLEQKEDSIALIMETIFLPDKTERMTFPLWRSIN